MQLHLELTIHKVVDDGVDEVAEEIRPYAEHVDDIAGRRSVPHEADPRGSQNDDRKVRDVTQDRG